MSTDDSIAQTVTDVELKKLGLISDAPPCPECGGPGDDRTAAGMKCGACAYGKEDQ
jgi:hypothetical protein